MKVCNGCSKELHESMFHKNKASKDGLYHTCKPCRTAINASTKEQRAEYKRAYYRANKEQVDAKNMEYQHSDAGKASRRRYTARNSSVKVEYDKAYYLLNKDCVKQRIKAYLGTEQGRLMKQLAFQRRRALEKEHPFELTIDQWKSVLSYFNYRCCYCDDEVPLEIEHFIALSKGGTGGLDNILPACKRCNCSKKAKDFYEWYPKQPFYSEDRLAKIIIAIEDLA